MLQRLGPEGLLTALRYGPHDPFMSFVSVGLHGCGREIMLLLLLHTSRLVKFHLVNEIVPVTTQAHHVTSPGQRGLERESLHEKLWASPA